MMMMMMMMMIKGFVLLGISDTVMDCYSPISPAVEFLLVASSTTLT